ncbi:MAG: STAS/SEC14 domain-containing protein [Terriglobales bacterium]
MDDRIHFIEHQGKQILLIDYSHATAQQMLLLLEHVRITVAKHGRESLLILADFSAAEIDRTVATRIKEVLTLDRPFVKKAAWVGTEDIPHAFMESFHTFSQREIVTFKTREEAMDWLVKD